MRAGLRIAVVMPALNEADVLPRVIPRIPSWVDEVYVVDDGSTDDSAGAARQANDPRVVVLQHESCRGVGASMKTGYRAALAARADVVAKIDADGQMDPCELDRLVDPLVTGLAEYTKGNRFRHVSGLGIMPQKRKFGNVGLSFLTKISSGYWHVFDSQCGYTAVLAHELETMDLDHIANDYFFENDMLINLAFTGSRVVDVPVSVLYGEEVSDLSIRRVLQSFPGRLFGRWVRRIIRQHVLWDFGAPAALGAIGLPAVVFGVAFGAYHWWVSIATDRVASTGTVMIAVLPIVVGVQMLLQALLVEIQTSPGAEETRVYARRLATRGREEDCLPRSAAGEQLE